MDSFNVVYRKLFRKVDKLQQVSEPKERKWAPFSAQETVLLIMISQFICQKAIQECETELSNNKKSVDLRGRDVCCTVL